MQPDKSLVGPGEDGRGVKRNKQRLTVLLCANMDGSDKRRMLIIGKSAKPRCFKGVTSLPVEYKANTKAWMTGDIWKNHLQQWNRQLTIQRRLICLVIDNCAAHPPLDLSHIRIVYLPPNTTSTTQPMDQGIIANLKSHYRRRLVLHGLIGNFERGNNRSWTVLDAIASLDVAWQAVTAHTIARCFAHARFVHPEMPLPEVDEEDPDDDLPLSMLVRKLAEANVTVTEEELAEFINTNEDLPTSASMTDAEIAAEVKGQQNDAEYVDEDDEEETPPLNPLTLVQCLQQMEEVRSCYLRQKNPEPLLALLNLLESLTKKEICSTLRQGKIEEFF